VERGAAKASEPAAKPATTARAGPEAAVPSSAARSASTAWVSGLARMTAASHGAACATGKTAPESSHDGMRITIMTAW
jgi:hypothetical protein